MSNDKLISFLAETFRNTLLAEIGKKNFAEMKRRNKKETRRDSAGGVCHSHDFCDANMVMYAAFIDVTGREMCHSNEDLALWNAAWNEAFTKYFS